MVRYFLAVFLMLGMVGAPVALDGTNDAMAQKAKKVKKKKKTVRRAKSVYRGKKGTRRTKAKAKAAGKKVTVKLHIKRAIRNTNAVLGKARDAVKVGTKGKQQLRDAVVRQHAARAAYAKGKPRQAFFLTRTARGLAKEIIVMNGLKADDDKVVPFKPEPADMDGVDEIIKGVEDANTIPPVDQITDMPDLGTDLPEDLGDDDPVLADPDKEPEVEVEVEGSSGN